jgi:hypothetical protein
MGFQFDVKSKHASVSGLLVGGRTRLKGAVMFPFTGATEYAAFVDDVSIPGTFTRTTTVATITSANHGLAVGDWVYLDWGLTDNPYQIQTSANANTFTVTVPDTGITTGAVTIWYKVLLQADASNATAYTIAIPGDGIVAPTGLRVFLPANFHTTAFYG